MVLKERHEAERLENRISLIAAFSSPPECGRKHLIMEAAQLGKPSHLWLEGLNTNEVVFEVSCSRYNVSWRNTSADVMYRVKRS